MSSLKSVPDTLMKTVTSVDGKLLTIEEVLKIYFSKINSVIGDLVLQLLKEARNELKSVLLLPPSVGTIELSISGQTKSENIFQNIRAVTVEPVKKEQKKKTHVAHHTCSQCQSDLRLGACSTTVCAKLKKLKALRYNLGDHNYDNDCPCAVCEITWVRFAKDAERK